MTGRRLGPGGRGSERDEARLTYMKAAHAKAKSITSLSLLLRDMLTMSADVGKKRKGLLLEAI